MSVATVTQVIRPTAAARANAARQPTCWPSQVPAGTPSTGPRELPIDMRAIARPRISGGNIAAAAGVATDQNSAWVAATSSRAASSVG